MITYRWKDVDALARELAGQFAMDGAAVYGVPQGGIPAALLVARHLGGTVVDYAGYADLIIDDVYDSGKTLASFMGHKRGVLVAKKMPMSDIRYATLEDDWVRLPWDEGSHGGPEDAVRRLIQFVGRDPDEEVLRDTPRRYLSALSELAVDGEEVKATAFSVGAYDQMVVVSGIEFSSLCEHHLLPFRGEAAVGYIPNGEMLGLSKLARFVHKAARGLQTQERMTDEVRSMVDNAAGVPDVAVVIRAQHLCMEVRGVKSRGATMTSSLGGAFRDDPATRAEFLEVAR